MQTKTLTHTSGIWPFRFTRTYTATAKSFVLNDGIEWTITKTGKRASPRIEAILTEEAAQQELTEIQYRLTVRLNNDPVLNGACAERHANGAYGWWIMKSRFPLAAERFADEVAQTLFDEAAARKAEEADLRSLV